MALRYIFVAIYLLLTLNAESQSLKLDSLKKQLLESTDVNTEFQVLEKIIEELIFAKAEQIGPYYEKIRRLVIKNNLTSQQGSLDLLAAKINNNFGKYDSALFYSRQSYHFFKSHTNPNQLIRSLLEISSAFTFLAKYDSAEFYGNEALNLAAKTENNGLVANALANSGLVKMKRGSLEEALELYNQALENFKESGKTSPVIFTNIANVYRKLGNYQKALEFHYQALEYYERNNQSYGMAICYNNIGIIHDYQKDYDKALDFYFKAIELQKTNRKYGLSLSYNNVGIIYKNKGEYQKALEYYLKSLKLKEELKNEHEISGSYSNLGVLYLDMGDYQQALEYHLKSLALRKNLNDKYELAISYANLGLTYTALKQFELARENFDQALKLATAAKAMNLVNGIYLEVHNLYLEMNDHDKALEYYKKSVALNDSLFNAAKARQLAEIETKYETEKKNQALSLQQLQLDQQQNAIIQQRILFLGLIMLLLLIGIIFYLAFTRYKLRQRNRQLETEQERNKLSQDVQVRLETDATINYFATSLFGKNSVDEILWDVAKNCISSLGLVDCVIYLLDEQRSVLVQKAAYGTKNPVDYEIHAPIEIPLEQGIVGAVARNRQPELINDTSQDPRYLVDDEMRLSELAVPILFQDKVLGVIDSEHPQKNFYKTYHLDTLKVIASICASKIVQMKADEEAQKARIMQLEAEKIKEVDQLKSRFFANISHEFRTPLNLILGPIQNNPETMHPQEIELIHRNAKRLLRLVNQLLDLAKMEVGQMKPAYQSGNLSQFLKQLAASFEPQASARHIDYQVSIDDSDFTTAFDPEKLENIFYNLVANAIKFTKDQGKVAVQAVITQNNLQLIVSDTGIGIPEHTQHRIFERFFQADSSQTRRYEGTGIGLALTRELVELLGGNIAFSSQEDAGTEFKVNLPLQSPNGFPEFSTNFFFERSAIPAEQADDNVPVDQEGPVILIVEDNNDLRKFTRNSLQSNYQVIEAEHGKEALTIAMECIPDVIITDVMMPEMDGIEFTHRIKSDPLTCHIPVIMLTARDDAETKRSGFKMGADQYLPKPFDLIELQARLESLLLQRDRLREKFSREITLKPREVSITDFDAQFLEKLMKVVENNLEDSEFSVEQLQQEMAMSRMQLHRKLKALTNQSASEFIRKIRLQKAAQMLSNPGYQVAEVAYSTGFNHLSYFAKCFKEMYGVSPSEFVEQKHINSKLKV